MEISPYKILIFDALGHAVLIIDGPSGEILTELPLPKDLALSDLAVSPDYQTAYFAFNRNQTTGTFCFLDLKTFQLSPFYPALPYLAHFSAVHDTKLIYFADGEGNLYCYDFSKLIFTAWDKPPGRGRCAGLANSGEQIYGVWESAAGGILAVYARSGQITEQYAIGGIPNGLTLDCHGRLFVPFTATAFCGEGVVIIAPLEPGKRPSVATISCSCCSLGARAYPLHVAVDSCGQLAYVACEDNATIGIIDIAQARFCGSIHLGRSISRLALLPDKRFAIASSNMFADLCLIDLVNKRPLSFSATKRELLSPFAVIN